MSDATGPDGAGVPAPPPPPVPTTPQAPAGWYPESPTSQRYWDGSTWTEHRAPLHHSGGHDLVFAGRSICNPWERFGAYLLDSVLMFVTLFIGWLIWACITAQEGQTPGKKLLGQRVYRLDTGQPATFGWMLGMRGIVAGVIFQLSFWFLIGFVLIFMPFWDRRNQTVVDKISSTVVVIDR